MFEGKQNPTYYLPHRLDIFVKRGNLEKIGVQWTPSGCFFIACFISNVRVQRILMLHGKTHSYCVVILTAGPGAPTTP